MRIRVLTFVLAIGVFSSQFIAAATNSDKVADQFVPAPYESQQIGGVLGDRMEANLRGRLLHLDEPAVLKGFQQRPGEQAWCGEHAGKFLDAAANTWAYTRDESLKALMDRVARGLIATQLSDGYLGTYTNDQRWTSWDVWVHKYDLLGLLAYYRATGYTPALESCRRIGNLLCHTFGTGTGQRDIIESGTHVGMAATSVLEPMVKLYEATGDPKYLEFCNYLVRSWDQPNGPKIIALLQSTGSVYRTANAKAYEMMSNLVGLAELYRVTGNPIYLRTAQIAWQDITSRRLFVTGTTSSFEHFADDRVLPGEESSNVGEGCATVTWLQLNWELLRLTGAVQYGEELERTVYNALLGAQDPSSGNICYFTPLNGKKSPTPGINCCVSSEPRGISMIPQIAWGSKAGGVAVLLYVPGHVKLATSAGDVTIELKTNYPAEGTATLTVVPVQTSHFPLYLRVPKWTTRYTAAVGGNRFDGIPGEFLTIERQWSPGDQVNIEMELATRVITGGPSYPYSVAIARGPQILALEQEVNPGVLDLQAAGPRSEDVKLRITESALPPHWCGHQAYDVDGQVAGNARPLTLVPFADAHTYRVWLLKP